jgi:hypothetical protein
LASRWIWIFKAFASAIIFASTLGVLYAVGPWVETRFFPVVEKLQILRAEPGDDGATTVLHAAFRKIRDCEYIGMSWFRGDRAESFERVPVVLMRREGDTSSPNRPLGYQRAGPWVIHVPPDELATKSFAILHHRCHGLWTSNTEFYP